MIRVQTLVEELRGVTGLSVEDGETAWLIRIPKGENLMCEVTVPRERFEWFAAVKRRGEKKDEWSDWMDHYGSADVQLDSEMAESIRAFVERVLRSEIRLPLSIYEKTGEPDGQRTTRGM